MGIHPSAAPLGSLGKVATMTALFEAIARRLHPSDEPAAGDPSDRYEAMLDRNRPLAERQAEATRRAAAAPVRKLPRRAA